jgi:CPA2 family monovalent cation:H+ antiporter-2
MGEREIARGIVEEVLGQKPASLPETAEPSVA